MIAIRDAYLEAAASAAALLGDPAVAAAWGQPSALKEFSVAGLAGHLGSQVGYVSRLLAAESPDAEPLSVVEFYARAEAFHVDVDAEINVRIREGGEAAAANGAEALASEVASAVDQQRAALSTEPADRVVSFTARPLLLNDFLLTRMMEIVVHSDDLALSVDIATPQLPSQVFEPVLDLLSRLAVHRHGQTAVLRALSRAERAPATIAGI
ncbi:maleylpyruvate isomerase N-terminal domain-containing protein [Saccharopolyspora sp. K220]|uniref:maleylpyruvate isomerase N-terminal domain-containing protein n=1 Tax=Saccharopolyspora soli TaxID=2926618 RepID=UPI001F58D14A|nr:maleylpyruvate isomerase N-terminal domain-containing protein [Saccharopolyspora soli]MCI2419099.1 maleylpyruvate isomerase N-terminal domain-containing protein [Saccharopolyspora soli]